MTDITITATGLDEVAAALQRASDAGGAAQRQHVGRVGERYVEVLKDVTPRGRGEQPGRLKSAYQVQEAYSATGARFGITNNAPYLKWALKGRGRVTAKRAKALRFVINGQVFFRRSVGPVKPNPFDEKAKQQMSGDVARLPEDIAAEIVRAFYGGGG